MKRHLQCAEQQKAASNFSKYYACHAKWISWSILLSFETSFTMRRATGITLQLHQIVRLPRKRNVMIDPSLVWNVIYNARSDRHHLATSPNTAPATQKECHDWSISRMKPNTARATQKECHDRSFSRMKRHLQCAEQQVSRSNLSSIILCLPRKRKVMIDPPLVWNVIYNERSNRHRPAASPNTAPACKGMTVLFLLTFETSFTLSITDWS